MNPRAGDPTLLHPDEAHREWSRGPVSEGLPSDLIRQAMPRLRVMALLYAAIFFLADFFPAVISGANRAILFSAAVRWVPGTISIAVALLVAAVVSNPRLSPRSAAAIAILFEIASSYGIAAAELLQPDSLVERDLVKTGISGLDDILTGGIPRGNVILLEGAIGTGKTTTGVEFVYRGASQFGEPGIIVLFEVSPEKVARDAAELGWDLAALEQQNRLKIIFTTRSVFRQELQQADSLLLDEAAKMGARRIFVDGVAG